MIKEYNRHIFISTFLAFFIVLSMLFCFWLGTKYTAFKTRKTKSKINEVYDLHNEKEENITDTEK